MIKFYENDKLIKIDQFFKKKLPTINQWFIDDDDNFMSIRNDENKVSREPEREPSKSTYQQTFEEQKVLSSRN
jgi:hypothetical protein